MSLFLDVDPAVWFLKRDCHCAWSGVNVGCFTIWVQPRLHMYMHIPTFDPIFMGYIALSRCQSSISQLYTGSWKKPILTTHCSSLAYKTTSIIGCHIHALVRTYRFVSKDGNTLYPKIQMMPTSKYRKNSPQGDPVEQQASLMASVMSCLELQEEPWLASNLKYPRGISCTVMQKRKNRYHPVRRANR